MSIEYTNQDKELLFKFMPLNLFSLQTIINNTLYFNKPDLLNDPLDCQFEIQISNLNNFSKKTVDFIKAKRSIWNQKLDSIFKNVMLYNNQELQKEFLTEFCRFDFNENHGICSFSQSMNDNLLWSHYANKAKGICIVFNKSELVNSINNRLEKSYYKLNDDFVRYEGVKKLNFKLIKDNGFSYTNRHLYSKTRHWKYEKEYRIVLKKIYKDWYHLNYPYEFERIIEFSPESIHSIILGEKIEPYDELLINNIVQNMNLNIPLQKFSYELSKGTKK